MELAGVTRDTKSPAGGDILKDAKGEPTGLFRETADGLLDQAYTRARASLTPEQREAYVRRQLQLADEEAVSKGVTSFEDAGSSFETIDVMKKVAAEGKLGLRLWVMIRDSNERMTQRLAAYRLVDGYDKHLTVRAIKHTLDGALGSRGAWLLEPYSDMPSSTGLETTPLATVRATAELAMQHGYQLCVHAIGDRATARRWTSSRRRSRPTPTRKTCAGASSTRSTSASPTSRASAASASSRPCRGSTATSDAVFVPARLGAKRSEEGPTSGRSS